jgi:uncharacterized protein YcfJ
MDILGFILSRDPVTMSIAENFKRIHPLVAVAAVSVTLLSLAGIAAITGVLPTSQGANREAAANVVQVPEPSSRAEALLAADEAANKKHASKATQPSQLARTPQSGVQGTGTESVQHNPAPAPANGSQTAHKPAAQNSPVGIGVGAVIGGVLGNQVGSGDGKTLATILGAVGGGYIGNEVAKKNQ